MSTVCGAGGLACRCCCPLLCLPPAAAAVGAAAAAPERPREVQRELGYRRLALGLLLPNCGFTQRGWQSTLGDTR